MCAINPKHKKRLVLDFYTSHKMTAAQFEMIVTDKACEAEQLINSYGKIRVHVKFSDQEAE